MTPPDPPSRTPSGHDPILEALPWARRMARVVCRSYGVREQAVIEDAEQLACGTMLELRSSYDKAKGPFQVYAWKPVVGAVTRFLRVEGSHSARRNAADQAGLDEAADLRDESDVLSDSDKETKAQLLSIGRRIMFRRVMAGTRVALAARPDDAVFRMQVLSVLRESLQGLTEREERVIQLRYWEDKTWDEVGDALGVDKRQALRIHKQIRTRLERDLLEQGVDAPPPSGP